MPTDQTKWTTLSDAIVAVEHGIYYPLANGGAKIIASVGYDAGSEVPVFNKTYATDGTFSPTTVPPAPGDVAALVRYSTSARTTKNHPIYLFNYYHTMPPGGTASTADQLLAAMVTNIGVYAADWVSGFSDGTTNHKRCSPQSAVATGFLVESQLTHRDLPR